MHSVRMTTQLVLHCCAFDANDAYLSAYMSLLFKDCCLCGKTYCLRRLCLLIQGVQDAGGTVQADVNTLA